MKVGGQTWPGSGRGRARQPQDRWWGRQTVGDRARKSKRAQTDRQTKDRLGWRQRERTRGRLTDKPQDFPCAATFQKWETAKLDKKFECSVSNAGLQRKSFQRKLLARSFLQKKRFDGSKRQFAMVAEKLCNVLFSKKTTPSEPHQTTTASSTVPAAVAADNNVTDPAAAAAAGAAAAGPLPNCAPNASTPTSPSSSRNVAAVDLAAFAQAKANLLTVFNSAVIVRMNNQNLVPSDNAAVTGLAMLAQTQAGIGVGDGFDGDACDGFAEFGHAADEVFGRDYEEPGDPCGGHERVRASQQRAAAVLAAGDGARAGHLEQHCDPEPGAATGGAGADGAAVARRNTRTATPAVPALLQPQHRPWVDLRAQQAEGLRAAAVQRRRGEPAVVVVGDPTGAGLTGPAIANPLLIEALLARSGGVRTRCVRAIHPIASAELKPAILPTSRIETVDRYSHQAPNCHTYTEGLLSTNDCPNSVIHVWHTGTSTAQQAAPGGRPQ
ncbi:hypothetical protein DFJ73DRAFT_899996 [Zopfochytrium polystomum]|nr:hypothetical protein DFJ73DRAFT_899996 [Zopfochytrium polystomum]